GAPGGLGLASPVGRTRPAAPRDRLLARLRGGPPARAGRLLQAVPGQTRWSRARTESALRTPSRPHANGLRASLAGRRVARAARRAQSAALAPRARTRSAFAVPLARLGRTGSAIGPPRAARRLLAEEANA